MNELNKNYCRQYTDILSLRDLAKGTISAYLSYLTQFITWTEDQLSAKPLSQISWEELRSYLLFLKNVRKLNPRTINLHIAQLRSFYQYILHREWDRFQIPFLRFDEPLPKVPTKQEVVRLIDSTSNLKHKTELALLYSSGLRVSELCRLHCGDIWHSKNCIYISKSKNRSDRYAVLSKKAYALLPGYIRQCYPRAEQKDWLFPGQNSGSHIHPQSIAYTFDRSLLPPASRIPGLLRKACVMPSACIYMKRDMIS